MWTTPSVRSIFEDICCQILHWKSPQLMILFYMDNFVLICFVFIETNNITSYCLITIMVTWLSELTDGVVVNTWLIFFVYYIACQPKAISLYPYLIGLCHKNKNFSTSRHFAITHIGSEPSQELILGRPTYELSNKTVSC